MGLCAMESVNQQTADARLAAMLPAQLLQDGEVVVLLIKPSLWFIVLEPLATILGLAMLTAGGVGAVYSGWLRLSVVDVILAGGGLVGLRLFWQFLEWLSRVYVLTDRRVIRVRGVLRVHVFECALKRIQHTEAVFSLRERLFGLGTIHFATAGTAGIEASWRMVARPLEVHRIVVQTLQRYR